MDSDDLATLIARTALRDRVAFSVLYQKTSAKLFGVCLRILYDRGDAEEALQEVYVKVWRDADRFAIGKGSPISWLIAIARNHAIDVLRARKPVSRDIEEVLDIADASPDPETVAVKLGERKRMDDCFGELAPDRAQAVRMAYIEGYGYRELATRFDVPLNTMRTWLRRSLIKLKECLER